MDIRLKRAYDPAASSDGYRVLIDRLWPRGVSRERAQLDEWERDLPPSTRLRQWFGHEPGRFEEFRRRYIGASEPTPAAHRAAAAGPQRHAHPCLLRQGHRAQRRRRPRGDLAPRIAEGWEASVKVRKPLRPTARRASNDMLTAADARWEKEGGALEGGEPSDLSRGDFSIAPEPPFRLDLSVWALRRRPPDEHAPRADAEDDLSLPDGRLLDLLELQDVS